VSIIYRFPESKNVAFQGPENGVCRGFWAKSEMGGNWGKLGKIGENRENRENPNFRKNPRKSENNTLARKTPSI
jgi:hypothetical protein